MISKNFFEALEATGIEKGLSIDEILAKVEMAMGVACRDTIYKGDIKLDIDYEKKRIRVYDYRYVVEELTEGNKGEILLEEAQELKPKQKMKPGMVIKTEVDLTKMGRKAVSKFKNTLSNELKNLEREAAFLFFEDKVGEIVTAKVLDSNERGVLFSMGKSVNTMMPLSEAIPGEVYQEGSNVKIYIQKVEKTTKGPKISISRATKDIVKRLFEDTIPEIANGSIEIVNLAREAGKRTKIGVMAVKPGIDPKGACVGQGGLRIKSINEALNDEKIDIFVWKNEPIDLIAEALLPAKSLSVIIDNPKLKKALVIVKDEQYSLAIGKEGQNVRLAAYAIDWRIDIMRLSEAVKEGISFTYNVIQK